MTSRQRAATSSARRDDRPLWSANDSDSDRPRMTMAASQRHNIDQAANAETYRRHHTSSRRMDASNAAPAADGSQRKSSSKHRSATVSTPSYSAAQSQNYAAPSGTPASTSQGRAHDGYPDDYNLRAYMKKRSEKRSPLSSNERVALPDDARTSRAPAQARGTHPTASTTVQAPTSTQTYWIDPASATHNPSSSSRRERERDKDKVRERRREEKEKEKDETRSRDPEREREREKEKERERRKQREKEKERISRDKDKDRDRESRKRVDRRVVERGNGEVAQEQGPSSSNPQISQNADNQLPTVTHIWQSDPSPCFCLSESTLHLCG